MQTLTTAATFRGWLAAREGDDTAIGDLARDAARDPHWDGDDPVSLRQSMAHHQYACPAAYETLEAAAQQWTHEWVEALFAPLEEEEEVNAEEVNAFGIDG